MIHIMTDKMLNEIVSKAKTEVHDELYMAQKFDRLEHHLFELDARLMKLEHDGGMPSLERIGSRVERKE